jgi:hypothetical protein
VPFQPLPAPAVPVETNLPPVSASTAPVVEPPREKAPTIVPTMEEIDDSWDMPDEDPTASASADQAAAADAAMERPNPPTPPSSSDMAGDGSVGGDGIDEPGWD